MMKPVRLLIQHVHLIAHHQNPKIVKNTMTNTILIVYLIPLQTQNDYHGRQNSWSQIKQYKIYHKFLSYN